MNKSGFFTLNARDWFNTSIMFVGSVLLTTFLLVSAKFFLGVDFNVFNAPWGEIGKFAVNTAFISFVTSLTYTVKNFFSDRAGRFAGANLPDDK